MLRSLFRFDKAAATADALLAPNRSIEAFDSIDAPLTPLSCMAWVNQSTDRRNRIDATHPKQQKHQERSNAALLLRILPRRLCGSSPPGAGRRSAFCCGSGVVDDGRIWGGYSLFVCLLWTVKPPPLPSCPPTKGVGSKLTSIDLLGRVSNQEAFHGLDQRRLTDDRVFPFTVLGWAGLLLEARVQTHPPPVGRGLGGAARPQRWPAPTTDPSIDASNHPTSHAFHRSAPR